MDLHDDDDDWDFVIVCALPSMMFTFEAMYISMYNFFSVYLSATVVLHSQATYFGT